MNKKYEQFAAVSKIAAFRQYKEKQKGYRYGSFSTTDPALQQVPCTIQCVFIPRTLDSLQTVFDTCGSNTSPRIDIHDNGNLVIYYGGNSISRVCEIGKTYNVTFVVTETEQSAYLDGTLISTRSYETEQFSSYKIGVHSTNPTRMFQGDYLLHRHFNYAMSADEVKALNNNGNPLGYVVPNNLKNIEDTSFTPKTFEFDIDSPYYQRILESSELESGRKYKVDYVVHEWDIAPNIVGVCGISCGVASTVGTQYWTNIFDAKLGENQYVVVDTKETGVPYMFIYGSEPSESYTSRRLNVTVNSVKMIGLLAEYLPKNLMYGRDDKTIAASWLDSAKQLSWGDAYLPPLLQSNGGYDMTSNGTPEILFKEPIAIIKDFSNDFNNDFN